MKKINFKINGMSCASCSIGIENSLKNREGIKSAVVNYATESAKIEFDETKILQDDIFKLIKNMDYNPINSDLKNIEFKVIGMHSDHCAGIVKKTLESLNSVIDVETSFSNSQANAKYNPNLIKKIDLKNAIDDAGYEAIIIENNDNLLEQEKKIKLKELKTLKNKLMISGIFSIPILYLSMIELVNKSLIPAFLNPDIFPLRYALTLLILSIPIIVAGHKFYSVGFRNLFKGNPNMDSLIGLGTGTAYFYGVWAIYEIFIGNTEFVKNLYFETAGIIIVLILLGKYLEAITKGKTGDAIQKLMELGAKTAIVEREGKEIKLPVEDLVEGDIVIVKPGEKIPVDGEIILGNTSIDESMITGESIPTPKNIKDKVIGATINKYGMIKFKVTKVGKDTALAFLMAVTALSLPEMIILKKVLKTRLIVIFVSIVTVSIIFTGYLFNILI